MAVVVVSAFVVAFALTDPPDGPARDAVEWAESYVPDGALYGIHVSFGVVFGLCPCTADLSSSQYEKASLHRPPTPTPDSY